MKSRYKITSDKSYGVSEYRGKTVCFIEELFADELCDIIEECKSQNISCIIIDAANQEDKKQLMKLGFIVSIDSNKFVITLFRRI